MGYSVEVLEPPQGVSVRGTAEDQRFRGDVVRQLLGKREEHVDVRQPVAGPDPEPSVAVTVRQRASRRAVQQRLDAAEVDIRARQGAAHLVRWSNQHVGPSRVQSAQWGRGRRIPLLETTPVEVPLETGTSECRGVVKHAEGTSARGDQLATLRPLLDSAGLLRPVALSAMQGHEVALCRPLLEQAPVWRAGDLLRDERGCIDGATRSPWKRQRRVAVIRPLTAHMLATQDALHLAEMADQRAPHPSRADQPMAWGRHVAHRWAECDVPLNAGVMRCWNRKKQRMDQIVWVTTDLTLHVSWSVRHDEERPDIAPDDPQRNSGGWQRNTLSATRYSAIVLYLLTVVVRDSLSHLFANTHRGARCADKTRQAMAFAQLRTQRTPIIVDAGGYFALFATLRFVQMVWQLSPAVQARLQTWFAAHLSQMQKRE